MSIKDLFNKGYSLKTLKSKTQNDFTEDTESKRYIEAYSEKRHRYLPSTDFTTASNFARFGLAEEYYRNSIERIYQTYPYDGSLAEKTEWENESTYLDLFLFENEYPRTNGFININSGSSTYTLTQESNTYSSSAPEYILFSGGPHADLGGDYKSHVSAGPSQSGISKSNIYNVDYQRTSNLEIDPDKGVTIEFWMKKDGWADTSVIKVENIFNIVTASSDTVINSDYANLRVYSFGNSAGKNKLFLIIHSGSSDSFSVDHDTGLGDIADGNWHHYALTFKGDKSNLYVDSRHVSTKIDASSIGAIDGKLVATLGALAAAAPGHSTSAQGWGNVVSCSFDEFRYWKTERNAQQIGRYWRDQINGGTNTDDVKYDDVSNPVDLGVYFKFNEGITGNSATDASILDYSGRISNGTFINYNSTTSRNTGSAIVMSNAASKEFKDPIIYDNHPDVIALLDSKKKEGKMHDYTNSVSLYKSLPGWILEEDEAESNNLKFLMQIMASFFDDLYLQMENLPKLKDINYPDDNLYEKPLPFAGRLLETRGYDAPQLFAQASVLAEYLQRGENKLFEKKLYEIKNTIYQNIYNNLAYIQKSKGTFKSLRNFLRCFGVDEELVKLNIYANNDVYELKENFTSTALKKRFIDFDDSDTRFAANSDYLNSFSATAYQFKNSSHDNTISYIPGIPTASVTGAALTIEAEIILPKRTPGVDPAYDLYPNLTSSIFGLHAVPASDADFTFATDDTINFNVIVDKRPEDRRDGKFSIVTNGASDILSNKSSTQYIGLYDNQKWNLAFRLRPTNYSVPANVKDSIDHGLSDAYTYELYGNNYLSDYLQNEFVVSGTLSVAQAAKFFTEPKRIFIGAQRTNFTGSVISYSDAKISSVRAWYSYLDNETMQAHGKNSNTYGVLHPLKNSNFINDDSVLETKIPQIKTLLLNWNMDNVTGSDASGQFYIDDFSSGSSDLYSYGILSDVLEKNYSGRGDFFTSKQGYRDQAIQVEFVQTAKQKLPEVVNSDDMVKILNKQDDIVFTRDTTYVQHLLSIEKSMYQTISEEMIRFFASIVDFNNLIGEPVNRYRPFYKKMEKVRDLFFMGVETEPDLDKFIEFYKWIDDAVTMMIAQLIPASSNTVELMRNMVESHILERNKYWTKFPTLEKQPIDLTAYAGAVNEKKWNYRVFQPPLGSRPGQNTTQNKSSLWWKQRAERADVLSSGDAGVDNSKDALLKVLVSKVSGSGTTAKTTAGVKYSTSYYKNTSLTKVVDLEIKRQINLKAGSNPDEAKIHDYYKTAIKWGSDDDFLYLDMDNQTSEKDIDDVFDPFADLKKKVRIETLTMTADQLNDSNALGTEENDLQYNDAKSTLILPFSMYSSSISSDYRSLYADQFGLDFTNLHEDKYGPHAEIPLQGPFTKQHVGGMAHRHVKLNQGSDNRMTRPEGWHLETFLNLSSAETILSEDFSNASTTPTTDTSILSLPPGSESPEPSPYEYWRNGIGADNSWTFFKGATPSVGTGPAGGYGPTPNVNSPYAFCEVLPSKVGQTFSLVTPLIDLLDLSTDSSVRFYFRYHMHGLGIGNLRVQACRYRNFSRGVQDLHVRWGSLGSVSSPSSGATILAGQQHSSDTDNWSTAIISSESTHGEGLKQWLGKRFYIRFLYTAGPSHLGDCAIDSINFYKNIAGSAEVNQNSFKLLHPTYDDVRRPYATLTRGNLAKSPVNIRNIHMTGNSPTVAGNYLNRYEYVNTTSPENNDPYFVKNNNQINAIHPEIPFIQRIQDLLSTPPGAQRKNSPAFKNYTLPDRSFLTGTIKNKTRILTRFSAPGGYEVTSRGFLDPAHETFSVYNVTTFRNLSARTVHNTQLQAHQGQFGVSAHNTSAARVFGSETVGAIKKADYTLTGDASFHKYHRNNIERIELTGASQDFSGMTAVTASSFDNAFVSHMIPRTDQQTRWITASII